MHVVSDDSCKAVNQQRKKKTKQDRPRWERMLPVHPAQAYFQQKPLPYVDKWNYCRILAKKQLSIEAQLKLEWIIFYHTAGKKNLIYTATHFGITQCTLRKWIKRFNEDHLKTLEEHSRAPIHRRTPVITYQQEIQIKNLRKKYMKLGRKKQQILYKKQYGETISDWKIGRIIKKYNLFPHTVEQKQKLKTRRKLLKKIRIHHMKEKIKENKDRFGYLWHVDSVVIWWNGKRRCLLTALEEGSKFAYARAYSNNTARTAEDFLKRLLFLVDGKVEIIHSDNGGEFAGVFEEACINLGIQQIYSRPHTPKDNPKLEKFNNTIQYEWLEDSPVGLDIIEEANRDLTEWLIFYNSVRPHQSIGYLTPVEYLEKQQPVLDNMFATNSDS